MRALISSLSMRTSIVSVLIMFCLMLLAGAGLGLLPLNAANQGFLSNTGHAERAASVQQTAAQLQHAQMALQAAERLQASVAISRLSGYASAQSPNTDFGANTSIAQLRQQYELARDAFARFGEQSTSAPQELAASASDITRNWQQSENTIASLIRSLQDSNWNTYTSAHRDYLTRSKALDMSVATWLDASAQPIALSAREARQTADSALARYHWVVVGVILGCIMATLLTLVTYIYLNHQVLRPVRLALAQIETTAQGDLTPSIQIVSRNELGQLSAGLQHMQSNLTRIVRTVRSGVEEIRVGAGEIASGNNDLSERTERQAAFIEQTTSSLSELSSRVLSNADSARMADQQTSNSMAVAQRGGTAMAQVVETMHDISDRSHKISEIVGVIDGIAFQTNILALNAAVEAARAGESGRGFAVVAGEVRTLAQKSAQAAREIKTLIAASTTAVEHGSKQVEDAGETMQEIVASVGRVSDIMHEISAASSEQSKGIEQVNEAIAHMDQATQQNAALVEEAAAAASSLQEQAQQLFSAVEVFKINRPGEIVDSHSPSRAPLLSAA